MIWLRLGLNPPLQIGGGDDAAAEQQQCDVIAEPVDLGGASGNANASITIGGVGADLRRRLLRDAPGASAQLYRGAVLIYSGSVDTVRAALRSRVVGLELQS